jgi:PKD repeat protein
MAPLAVNFTGSGTVSGGCGYPVTYDWDFGDGTAHSSQQNPSHTYATSGTFSWTLTATAGGQTCTKTGSMIVCALACDASVPTKGSAGLAITLSGSGVISGGCAPTIAYEWDFGDGSAHSTLQNPSHSYASAGNYTWTLRVTAGGAACTRTGILTIVNPPVISLIKKASPPFKIVVSGSNLQNGIKVYINDVEWTSVVWKNSGKIQLTGAIKTAVPKGVTKTFRFVNPDGGEASQTWGW